jgi:hypothetical protein
MKETSFMKLKLKWAGIAILLLVIYKLITFNSLPDSFNTIISICIGYFCMSCYLEERG